MVLTLGQRPPFSPLSNPPPAGPTIDSRQMSHTIEAMNAPMSRRSFLAMSASLGLGAAIAACGGSDDSATPATGDSMATGAGLEVLTISGDLQIVKRWAPAGLVPGVVRLPFSLADKTGILANDGKRTFPDVLTVSVLNAEDGTTLLNGASVTRRGDDLSVPYWTLEAEIDSEGVYVVTLDSTSAEANFQVENADTVVSPVPGKELPPFDTPTTQDSRGVNPICTRTDGICPFHDVTLTDALKSGKPVVYMIGTPAYCSTGTCAPGLDALMAVASEVGDKAVFVHADVYTDDKATTVAPAVQAYKLSYEPVLYVADAERIVQRRLDIVFDADEIRAALKAVGV